MNEIIGLLEMAAYGFAAGVVMQWAIGREEKKFQRWLDENPGDDK